MIVMENITKLYRMKSGRVDALRGISMEIERGDFLAVLGASGSGKSTLMNILGCLDRPSTGEYYLEGEPVGALDAKKRSALRGRKIGFVFQDFNLLPKLTALENVEMPLVLRGDAPKERRTTAAEALQRVGLEHRVHHKPRELSGGQQQRVATARALVTSPALILADEPTGNLDSRAGRDILRLLTELNRRGATIVLITHDPAVAEFCTRQVRLDDGKIA